MTSENIEKFNIEYETGKKTFENGDYRRSIHHLETAIALINPNSRLGGEVQMWLVTAYDAAEMRVEAIALCKQLKRHPHLDTREQSKNLLYILEAPKLTRKPEWLTEIPDLTALPEGESKFKQGAGSSQKSRPSQPKKISEPVDLSKVNTKDNRFIWVALMMISLAILALLWRKL